MSDLKQKQEKFVSTFFSLFQFYFPRLHKCGNGRILLIERRNTNQVHTSWKFKLFVYLLISDCIVSRSKVAYLQNSSIYSKHVWIEPLRVRWIWIEQRAQNYQRRQTKWNVELNANWSIADEYEKKRNINKRARKTDKCLHEFSDVDCKSLNFFSTSVKNINSRITAMWPKNLVQNLSFCTAISQIDQVLL